MNETQDIENHLLYPQSENAVIMEARLLLDPALREKMAWQQKTYALINEYGRKQLRSEIDRVHQELFTGHQHRSFRKKIMEFFK